MADSRDRKILRIGLIQNGKIVEERLLRRREAVTIGQSPRNTFVVTMVEGLPRTYTLFELNGGDYQLNFRSGMNGKVSVDGQVHDFRGLREQKIARKSGDNYVVSLAEQSRGKVVFGDVVVLFQFVTPPPPPSKLQLPASLKGGMWQRLDWAFVSSLLASFAIQVFSLAFILSQDYPEPPRGVETLPDRFVSMMLEKKEVKPPPPKKSDEKEEEIDEDKVEEKKEKKVEKKVEKKPPPDETPEQKARRKAKELRRISKSVKKKTVLSVLATKGGDGEGSIVDSLKDGAAEVKIDDAFSGTEGIMVATRSGEQRDGRISNSKGRTTDIDSGALKGTRRNVKSGGKGKEIAVKGRVKSGKIADVIGTGVLDKASISSVIARRKGAVKSCYEKQLKRNPKLRGKVNIQFTILRSGRVGQVRALEDTTGDPMVSKCIAQKMKRWRFPKPDGGEVTVAFPFLFAPSS